MPKKTRKYPTEKKTTTLEGKREYQRQWAREYRRRRKEKIAELKQLASQHATLTSALELAEKIKEL